MTARRAHLWAPSRRDLPESSWPCTCGLHHLAPLLRSARGAGPTVATPSRITPRRALEVAA